MKIVFLGTNGWFSTKTGNTICTLVESEKYYVVFDAGDGIQKLDKYATKRKPIFIFLSHLHLDHVIGMHIFPKFKRSIKGKVSLCFPKGLERDLRKIIGHPFIWPPKNVFSKFETRVLSQDMNNLPFSVEVRRLFHIDPAWGYRVALDGKTISYCCDTGKSENVLKLAKGADALIHECSSPPGFVDEGWGHVNPKEAAEIAKKAKVKKLYLTHFSPVKYPEIKNRIAAQKIARKIFKNTFVAGDEMSVET